MFRDKRPDTITFTNYSDITQVHTIESAVKSIISENLDVVNTGEYSIVHKLSRGMVDEIAYEMLKVLAYKKAEKYTVDKYRSTAVINFDNEKRSIMKLSKNDEFIWDSAEAREVCECIRRSIENSKISRFSEHEVIGILGLLVTAGLAYIEIDIDEMNEGQTKFDYANIMNGLQFGGKFYNYKTDTYEDMRLSEILDNWNFNLTSTTVYGALVNKMLKDIGKDADVIEICDNVIIGTVLEASLKGEYIKYMIEPYTYKFRGYVDDSKSVQSIEKEYTKELEKLEQKVREIEGIVRDDTKKFNKTSLKNSLEVKKDRIVEIKSGIQQCKEYIKNGIDRYKIQRVAEIDLVDNSNENRFACEMSIYNKDDRDVALKYFSGDTKILTTKDENFEDAHGYSRLPFGLCGVYMDTRALARCARENHISY